MRRVCVIGAGAAGLCAAQLCLCEGLQVAIYEQTDQIGGTWVYSPKTGTHSSMYEVLQTNLPKEVMAFTGLPFDESLPSFLDREHVLEYLKEYGRGIEVQLNAKVTDVVRAGDEWEVTIERKGHLLKAVFVCNGHYSQPYQPFDESHFRGRFIHSHDYRRASDFRDQKVALLGGGNSGIDIALQLCKVAREVVLIHHRESKKLAGRLPSNLTQRVGPLELLDHSVICEDGTEEGVDAIIVCTGYQYSFPFLRDLVQMVTPLWEHCVHTSYPTSLFLIGLNWTVVPFLLFEAQIRLCLNLMLGKTTVSPQQLHAFEGERLRCSRHQNTSRLLRELSKVGLSAHYMHFLGDSQFEYFDRLARHGRFSPLDTRTAQAIYMHVSKIRVEDVVNYKLENFHVEGSHFIVSRREA